MSSRARIVFFSPSVFTDLLLLLLLLGSGGEGMRGRGGEGERGRGGEGKRGRGEEEKRRRTDIVCEYTRIIHARCNTCDTTHYSAPPLQHTTAAHTTPHFSPAVDTSEGDEGELAVVEAIHVLVGDALPIDARVGVPDMLK
jgi:hypothetical protein